MSLFNKREPFMTRYDVYWLPDGAKGVPKDSVQKVWIFTRRKDGAYKRYDTKKEAVKVAKQQAKKNKPSELFVYTKGGENMTKHEYYGDHIYGDSVF